MARASTHTLLSLDRYASIMGINPAHFNQAAGNNVMPIQGSCSDVWYQYSWQNADAVSREDLAIAIRDAEDDIASILGYYPASRWISKEMHQYPRNYRRDTYGFGLNQRYQHKSVVALWGNFIEAGQRAVTLIGSPAVVFSDPDGDGYNELATITQATTVTSACELKVYFQNQSGNQEWEIRPPKSKTLSGGTLTVTFDAWQLIDPDLWEQLVPAAGLNALDLEASIYVSNVDVYREYTDNTVESAEFSWEPRPLNTLLDAFCSNCGGTGCVACENTIQTGCLHVRDVEAGILVPTPATYDADNEQWTKSEWTECREPDTVKIWYRAGELSERFLREISCEELSDNLARAITQLATARLERPLCACLNTHNLAEGLRRDMAFTPVDGGSFLMSEADLDNPFGTKKGEVMAWKQIARMTERIRGVAIV